MKKIATLSAIMIAVLTLSSCGQKGPLIVDQPALETPKTQDKELAPTI